MAAIDDLYIRIFADGSQLGAGLNQAQGKVDMFSQGISKLGGVLAGAFSVVAIEQFISKSIDAADESARAVAKVAQAIKTTAGASGQSLEGLREEADKIKGMTLFDDDQVLNDITAQLLTFSNVAGDTFKRAQMAALDLNTVLADGEGLTGTAIQLGKALNDPVKGITALQRSGVSFSPVQKELLANFVATNRLAEAQNVILGEIERQYGGQAVAAAKASNGVTQMNNSIGDLMKAIGNAISGSDAWKATIKDIGDTAAALASPDYTGWEKFAAVLWGVDDATIEYKKILAETAAAQRHIDEMDKKHAEGTGSKPAVPIAKKETTYADLKAELKDLQDSMELATVSEIGGINRSIDAVKSKIKAWEDSGKAVVNYRGTIKGLEDELTLLNTKRDTTSGAANVAAINAQIRKKEEEIMVLKNATTAWVAYGAAMSQSMTAMAAKSSLLEVPKAKLQSNAAFASAAMKNAEAEAERVKALNESINGAISGGLANMIESMAGAAGSGANIGQALLGSFGGLLTSLGGMLIKMGMGILAAKLALKTLNPYVAIA
ncbi:MAG: hypothetical protein NTX38_01020, partial [Methylobacter sp.]|nr:hypothetical protein [Methylobacter sp.]